MWWLMQSQLLSDSIVERFFLFVWFIFQTLLSPTLRPLCVILAMQGIPSDCFADSRPGNRRGPSATPELYLNELFERKMRPTNSTCIYWNSYLTMALIWKICETVKDFHEQKLFSFQMITFFLKIKLFNLNKKHIKLVHPIGSHW